jgi:hypothetical protein
MADEYAWYTTSVSLDGCRARICLYGTFSVAVDADAVADAEAEVEAEAEADGICIVGAVRLNKFLTFFEWSAPVIWLVVGSHCAGREVGNEM